MKNYYLLILFLCFQSFLFSQENGFTNFSYKLGKHSEADKKELVIAYNNRDIIVKNLSKIKFSERKNSGGICLVGSSNEFIKNKCNSAICIITGKTLTYAYKGPAHINSYGYRIGENKNKPKNCEGTVLWQDGLFFYGRIKASVPANGVLIYSSGKYYLGDVRNNEPHGEGKMFEDGVEISGKWENGNAMDTRSRNDIAVDCTQADIDIANAYRRAEEAKVEVEKRKEATAQAQAKKATESRIAAENNRLAAAYLKSAAADNLKTSNKNFKLDSIWRTEVESCEFRTEVEHLITGAYQKGQSSKLMKRLLENSKLRANVSDFKILINEENVPKNYVRELSVNYKSALRSHIEEISFSDIKSQEPEILCTSLNEIINVNKDFQLPFRYPEMRLIKVIFHKKDGDNYELTFMKNPKAKKIVIIVSQLLNQ